MKSILHTDGIYSSYWWNLFFLLMESILPIDGTAFSLVQAWAVPVAEILAFICFCAVKVEGVFRSKMCKYWILTTHCSIRGLKFWIFDLRLNYKISTLNLARNIFFMLSSSLCSCKVCMVFLWNSYNCNCCRYAVHICIVGLQCRSALQNCTAIL